ncbi:subtilisin family serine protease [Stackebrandtia endophytica]|uniref:Subtilisin family serine protease n=1 Tax=Stackebrandtia endophytica TaxID=1496996 RepID=A0A543AY45_9ACTN|nr:S8 family serine peptidase [Stackebrandtia endophytica]TQL77499.1 subtilisin family serine protease [Stackebrandtia endophytica]
MSKRWTRRLSASVALSATAALAAMSLGATPAQAEGIILDANQSNSIEGSYIVALKDGMSAASVDGLAAAYDGTVERQFASINGFVTDMSEADAKALAADPSVEYVAQNGTVSIAATQTGATWGLDRIDQRNLPLDQSYTYPDSAGEGVTAYIIDTGADMDHPDFGNRMTSGRDTVDNDDDAEDCQGHGTHVAGTIGGAEYGVAKNVDMVAVRVLDCNGSGSYDGVIAGIDWVTANAQKPAVANMSLGGGFSQAVNDAVAASIASGVTYSLAAGNDYGADACNGSPGSTEPALTVGATDSSDSRASFSNIGSCVDIFAPGVNITSAWLNGGTNTISGTSMAAPHVAGVAALHLGVYPSATPAEVGDAIVDNGTSGVVGNPGAGSPNLLLYMGYLNDTTPPGDNFSLSVDPTSGSVNPGESVTATVSTATTAGEAQSVSLSTEGAPSGVSAAVSPTSVTTGDSATLTLSTSDEAAGGTYTITVTATGSVTRTATFTLTVIGEGAACAGANDTPSSLPGPTTSVIDVTCDGVASAASSVTVDISYPWRGDLRIELISPDGSVYLLKAQNLFDFQPDVKETYTVDLSSEAGSGAWTLKVTDYYIGFSGTVNSWSINL